MFFDYFCVFSFCRLLIPSHTVHPARSPWNNLDSTQEVWIWWWPGAKSGLPLPSVSLWFNSFSFRVYFLHSLTFCCLNMADFFSHCGISLCSGWKFLQTAPQSSTTMPTSSCRASLTNMTRYNPASMAVSQLTVASAIWQCLQETAQCLILNETKILSFCQCWLRA